MGGGAPVSVQTMWDKPIREIDDSLIKTMESYHKKGCDLIRFALPSLNDVELIAQLIPKISMPLVGDIHFDYKIALKAIEAGFHKIRINPGNIGEDWKIREVIKAASDHGTAIRIGANEASLSAEQKARAKDDSVEERSRVLVDAAESNLELFEQAGFSSIVVSLKSSDIHVTYHSNKLFRSRHDYPLHLGITEAGPLIPAIVKSTVGLADLLKEGIGETVRISISDNPEYEVLAANELLGNLGLRHGRIQIISCPKCGRSSFDTHAFLESVKEELYTIPMDVTVAIMGCTVNGPGEASHADLGITGYGKQIQIFRHGKIIRREDPCSAKRSFSGRVGALAAGLILFFTPVLSSQTVSDAELPGWVLYEKGLASYRQGDPDRALEYFNLSAKSGDLRPEAIYRIGRIYEEEGDYLLAEERYKEALEDARFLYVPDDRWQIEYSLAGIYLNRGDLDRYEQLLLSIFDQEMTRNEEVIRREHSYVQMLKESGMDKLLLLFRTRLSYSLEAAGQLGVYYARSEAWKSSLIKNLYTVLSYFSGGLDLILEKDPDFAFPVDMEEAWEADTEFLISLCEEFAVSIDPSFQFSRNPSSLKPDNLQNDIVKAEKLIRSRFPFFSLSPSLYALRKMESEQGLEFYLEDERFYGALFYLAQSLYQEGFHQRALEVWKLLSLSGRDSSWKTLSVKALADPEISPPSLIY